MQVQEKKTEERKEKEKSFYVSLQWTDGENEYVTCMILHAVTDESMDSARAAANQFCAEIFDTEHDGKYYDEGESRCVCVNDVILLSEDDLKVLKRFLPEEYVDMESEARMKDHLVSVTTMVAWIEGYLCKWNEKTEKWEKIEV